MKRFMLASTMLTLAAAAQGQTTTMTLDGPGSMSDGDGITWTLTQSGSLQRNGDWVPGGGGTAAVAIVGGSIYGLDAHGRGWFALSGVGSSQYWTSSPAPSGITTTGQQTAPANQVAPAGQTMPASQTQGTPTQTVAVPPPSCGGTSSNQFGILPLTQSGAGQIIDSNGTLFVPRGINVMYGNGNPSAATLKATFPGINFLRLAIYSYNSPQELAPYVNDMTSNGIVVELEDHQNNAGGAGGSQGAIFSGQTLTNESNWYASVASYFKNNAMVWFGTNNEPSVKNASGQTDPGALSQWQRATYDAIRGAGNQSIVFLETICWSEGNKPVCNQGFDSSAYAGMSNVAWDSHVYGWLTKGDTNQAVNDQFVSDNVTALGGIKSAGNTIMPVVIAEYGNSTTGVEIDSNGTQIVDAVNKSVSNQGAAGAAAWAWGSGNPGDGLTNGGSGLSAYGQQVASAMTKGTPSVSVCQKSTTQTAQSAPAAGTTSVSITQNTQTPATQPDSGSTTPTLVATDPTIDPTYLHAATAAATSASQAMSAAIAAGQARMRGD